jgi:hypothetical protein
VVIDRTDVIALAHGPHIDGRQRGAQGPEYLPGPLAACQRERTPSPGFPDMFRRGTVDAVTRNPSRPPPGAVVVQVTVEGKPEPIEVVMGGAELVWVRQRAAAMRCSLEAAVVDCVRELATLPGANAALKASVRCSGLTAAISSAATRGLHPSPAARRDAAPVGHRAAPSLAGRM